MQIKLKTTKLQEMVAKAVKGSSNNKMIPITSLMSLSSTGNGGQLILTATDASNILKVLDGPVEGTEFAAVVPTELFSKLVAKTTTEWITISVEDNIMQIKGNGKYDIELPINDDGSPIKYPSYAFDTEAKSVSKATIVTNLLKTVINSNKVALAQTMENPYLTGYYFEDEVISTDSLRVCCNSVKLFDKPVLIPPELMDLVSLIDEDKLTIYQDAGKLLIVSGKIMIYGIELSGIEEYPITAIKDYLKTDFAQMVTLRKDPMLNILDRLSLFVSAYDQNGIFLNFDLDGLTINSRKSNGIEKIDYVNPVTIEPFVGCIDIELFKGQIAAQEGEHFELWFGHPKAIKMVAGKTTQITALMDDEDQFGSSLDADAIPEF